jgi:phage terminase small subunit
MNYSKYSKKTKDYLQSVESFLISKYGTISEEWSALIYLLADNLDLYEECKKSVKQFGLYDANTGKKNPLLCTMKDLQATIHKQIQHLGLSPYAISKIKMSSEDDTDDFINDLTNG